MSAPGRPKGEFRSAQHEGTTVNHELRHMAAIAAVSLAGLCTAVSAQAQTGGSGGTAGANSSGPYPPYVGDLPQDPGDIDVDLNTPVWLPGAVFPDAGLPGRAAYEDFQAELYRKYGIRFSAFYAQLYQHASDTLPNAPFDSANGGWGALQFSWTALNRGTDREGRLVMNLGWRNSIGRNAVPAAFGVPMVGAGYPALSLISLEANGVPRNYHRVEDTVDALDMGMVVRAADFGAAVALAAVSER